MEIIKEIVELTLLSGYLKGDQPGSLLIAAEIEEGKTHLVAHYASLQGVAYLADATAYGIFNGYQDALEQGQLKHLIFPDFIRPLSRPKETVSSLTAFLSELMEEGVQEIRTYATDFRLPRPVKAGVIACIARGPLGYRRRYWNETGFLSRLLVVSYRYSPETEEAVRCYIAAGTSISSAILALPPCTSIEIPGDLGLKLADIAKPLAQALYPPLHGFRLQKHLQRLAKASALREGRQVVDETDLARIRDMARFFNLDYNEV